MPRIFNQVDVLEIFQRLQSSFGKEHELVTIQLPAIRFVGYTVFQ